jgi:hypothetical protein
MNSIRVDVGSCTGLIGFERLKNSKEHGGHELRRNQNRTHCTLRRTLEEQEEKFSTENRITTYAWLNSVILRIDLHTFKTVQTDILENR